MSSNLPPVGPPSGPPTGPPPPPYGGPTGPPPPPYGAGPELLDSGAGGPMPPPPGASHGGRGGRGGRKGLIIGGGVVGLAAAAAGAFAVYQLAFATGPQPAEALPDTTVGYVSIDLDPSGKQKLEALETLQKFPAFDDNVDIDTDDDLRAELFEYVQDEGACPDLDFGDDIEPWLGDRFGFAAVEVGDTLAPDSEGIAPVGVIQVQDAEEAEAGLTKLRDCADSGSDPDDVDPGSASDFGSSSDDLATSPDTGFGDSEGAEGDEGGSESVGWSIQGDWVVIAETTAIAEAVTDAAADNPLSEDDDYEKWTDAAGDPGIVTAYIAPEAGAFIADAVGGVTSATSPSCSGSDDAMPEPTASAFPGEELPSDEFPSDEFPSDEFPDPYDDPFSDYPDPDCAEGPDSSADESTEALRASFEDFDGAAVSIRFRDGGLEVESASSVNFLGLDELYRSDRGDDVVSELPDDTAIAIGVGFDEGWFTTLTDYLDSAGGGFFDIEEGLEEIEEQTGLQLPEDAETLAGESAAIAIGGDFDPAAFDEDTPPSDQPVGLKVRGDPDAITAIIDRLLEDPAIGEELKDAFAYQTDDDHVVAGFSDDWSQQLIEGGDLGGSDSYQAVVAESGDAAAVLFVDFDKGGWLERAVQTGGGDPEVLDNVEPLQALGVSVWTDDDDVSHSVMKITAD